MRHCRYHAEAGNAGSQPRALPVGEEECFVRLDRPAQRQSVLVAPEHRLRSRLRKQVPRVQCLIAEKLEQSAVKLVAAGFSNHHDGAAVRSAVFRRVHVDIELEFRHAVDDGVVDHLPGLGLQHADTVIEVLIRARPAIPRLAMRRQARASTME